MTTLGKQVLILAASPRVGGNSDLLAQAWARGAEESGHKVEKVYLQRLQIRGCMGCDQCDRTDKPCVQKDGMQEIYTRLEKADVVVFASPIYFSWFSSQFKACLDRLYAIGHVNGYRYPHKECMLLMTAEDDRPTTFDLALAYYQRLADHVLKWTDRGSLTVGGVVEKGDVRHTDGLERAYRLGKSL